MRAQASGTMLTPIQEPLIVYRSEQSCVDAGQYLMSSVHTLEARPCLKSSLTVADGREICLLEMFVKPLHKRLSAKLSLVAPARRHTRRMPNAQENISIQRRGMLKMQVLRCVFLLHALPGSKAYCDGHTPAGSKRSHLLSPSIRCS
jgi:hypothetical protein